MFGTSGGDAEDHARARALGARLVEAGFGVVNGGYGGTMEASARGAREAGGRTRGVTCALFTDRAAANPYLDEVVEAPTLTARLESLLGADGYVVLPGGNGTLIELCLAWEHLRKGLVAPRPLVAWAEPWRPILERLADGSYVATGTGTIAWVESVAAALAAVTGFRAPAASY